MMIKQSELVGRAIDEAFETHDGLCAWRRDSLPDVAMDLANGGHAIVGGEVWVVEGNLFSPLSPTREGGWAIFSWESPPRLLGEPWEHYVTRTLREALDTVRALDPEGRVPPEFGSKLYYHLRVADELGYNRLQKSALSGQPHRGGLGRPS